jgi:uncharacterized protein (DUF58 family)
MADRLSIFLAVVLLGLSLLLRSPLLFLLAALLALMVGASALWGKYCLAGVSYARRFAAERLFCGEETDLWVEVTNAKPLPLAWLKAEDEFPQEFAVQRVKLDYASQLNRRLLTNVMSLLWYERVRRHYRLLAERRGAFDFGPVVVSSGDIFGFRTRALEIKQAQTVLVYPKIVPLARLGLQAARPLGEHTSLRRILEDPLRLAGVRDYQPGDSVRHVHWKTTARRGALQTKVFDPSAARHLVICLNSQTTEHAYEGVIRDYFETAAVVAASLAHAGLEARHPVGLYVNSSVPEAEGHVRLPASRHTAQQTRLLESLALMTAYTLMPFEKLLRLEAPHLPYGATLIAVSAVVTEAILSALLDLRAAGHPVALVGVGPPPPASLPAEVPAYFVTQNWTDLEALELG